MRPDEHKKKNSARYKKKHGTDSKATNTTKTSQKDPEVKATTNVSNSTELDIIDENQQKSFSRRQVTSNWDRYEEPEEVVEQIGADFKQLVGAAGGADSHMVLESEKHWGDKQNLDQILTIDFEKLATSLNKLPFFERLGLNENQFDPALVKLLNDDSSTDSGSSALSAFTLQEFDFQNPKPVKMEKARVTQEEPKLEKYEELVFNASDTRKGAPETKKPVETPKTEKLEKNLKTEKYEETHKTEKIVETQKAETDETKKTEETQKSKSGNIEKASHTRPIVLEETSNVNPNTNDRKNTIVSLNKNTASTSSTDSKPLTVAGDIGELELELDSLLTGPSATRSLDPKSKLQNATNSKPEAKKTAEQLKKVPSNKELGDLEDWLETIL